MNDEKEARWHQLYVLLVSCRLQRAKGAFLHLVPSGKTTCLIYAESVRIIRTLSVS